MRTSLSCAACIGALWWIGCNGDDNGDRVPDAMPPDELPAAAPVRAELIADDLAFSPSRIVVVPGQTVIVSLRNDDMQPHSIAFELPRGTVALASELAPGERGELRFEAPEAPGEYTFFCPVANHRELGMVGQLIVERPAEIGIREIAAGLVSPVMVAAPPDTSGRLFVVDQVGQIFIINRDGGRLPEPFLDVSDRIVELREAFDERGLLGIAFHPEYAANGRMFAYYSAPLREGAPPDWDHTGRIVELRVSDDPDLADPDFERIILEIDEPQFNHNGGTLAFGPDGMLYISLGDGGGAGDTGLGHTPDLGNAQDRTNLLGSILRIDVDGAEPYAIPGDNPFVGAMGEDEIWAYGLRNPYRMSFDRGGEHGLLAADAGQALYEEVSRIERGNNYGWNILEGRHCFDPENPEVPPASCPQVGAMGEPLVWPVVELAHDNLEGGLGNVVIGGFIYRGEALRELQGRYVFGVFDGPDERASGALYTASPTGDDEVWPIRALLVRDRGYDLGTYIKGFGEDAAGEIYVVTSDEQGPVGATGRVWRIVPPGG